MAAFLSCRWGILGPPKQRDLCDLRHKQLERVWNHYPVPLLHLALFWFQAWKAYLASPLSAPLPTLSPRVESGSSLPRESGTTNVRCEAKERGALSPHSPQSCAPLKQDLGYMVRYQPRKSSNGPWFYSYGIFFFSCTFFRRLISWPSLCASLIYPTHIVRTFHHSSGHNASATKPLAAPTDCGLKPNFSTVAFKIQERWVLLIWEPQKFVMKCFSKKPQAAEPQTNFGEDHFIVN